MPYFKLRFINNPGIVGKLIDWETNSIMDHTEIETETGTWIGAHAGGGVEERAADYCSPTFERRYSIPCSDEQLAAAMGYARSKIGTPYDFKDIFGLLIHNRHCNGKHSEICSMFVLTAALRGEIKMLNALPEFAYLITPETLHLSNLLIGNCTFHSEKS